MPFGKDKSSTPRKWTPSLQKIAKKPEGAEKRPVKKERIQTRAPMSGTGLYVSAPPSPLLPLSRIPVSCAFTGIPLSVYCRHSDLPYLYSPTVLRIRKICMFSCSAVMQIRKKRREKLREREEKTKRQLYIRLWDFGSLRIMISALNWLWDNGDSLRISVSC